MLDRGELAEPADLVDHDFWLLDDEVAVRMHYAEDGQFLGATVAPELLGAYRAARSAALAVAQPFALWWRRHPELHREARRNPA